MTLNYDEIIEEMVGAYDAETMREEECKTCKGTGIIRIGRDPDPCGCGMGVYYPATDESCMKAAFQAFLKMLPKTADMQAEIKAKQGCNVPTNDIGDMLYRQLLDMRKKDE